MNVDAEDVVVEETPEETKPTERDWTAEAQGMGWNSEYDGPDKIDAREYVLRKPLFDEMKKLRRKSRDLEAAILAQRDVQAGLLAKQREELLSQLKEQKVRAIEEGDAKKVVAIEDEIDKHKSTLENVGQPSTTMTPGYEEWVANNSWYENDEDMQAWADAYGFRASQRNPARDVDEIYKEISKKVRSVFPHKFENKNRTAPLVVEGSTAPASKNKESDPVVPKEYRDVARAQWKAGAFGDVPFKEGMKIYAEELRKAGFIDE